MLSCRRATELMEKELHFKLNTIEKIQLHLHTRMCDACKLYEKQNKVMDRTLTNYISRIDKNENLSTAILSDDFKKSLIKTLEKK